LTTLTREFAEQFAQEWIASWNAHDLERIFGHYTDDFEMSSPLIVERMNEPSGTLRGKDAIRPYWSRGLATTPPLHFELDEVLLGVRSVVLVYRNALQRRVTETLFFDDRLRVNRGMAHYGAPPAPAS
jgi:ketosteroid isomerase-like protein